MQAVFSLAAWPLTGFPTSFLFFPAINKACCLKGIVSGENIIFPMMQTDGWERKPKGIKVNLLFLNEKLNVLQFFRQEGEGHWQKKGRCLAKSIFLKK